MQRSRFLRFAVALHLITVIAAAYENSDAFVEHIHRVSPDYETPHTKWAKPYAQGTVRVFYTAGSRSEGMETHAREIMELAQRFDFRIDAAYWFNFYRYGWVGGVAGHKRISRLMDQPYDVFVFQDVSPTNFPTWPWEPDKRFLDQVRQGAGVVLLGTDDGGLFRDVTPLDPVPDALTGCPVLKTALYGKGRMVWLPPRPVIGYHVGWEVEYEDWQQQLGRAVLWAANRAPVPRLALTVPAKAIPRDSPPDSMFTAVWSGADPDDSLESSLRSGDGEFFEMLTFSGDETGKGTASWRFPPTLRAGTYRLEVWLRSSKGVSAWAVAPFDVMSGTVVQQLNLAATNRTFEFPPGDAAKPASIRTGAYAPFVDPGEPIAGEVKLAGPLAGLSLRIRLVDRRARVLAEQVLPARETQAFSFRTADWMPMLLRVEASVMNGLVEWDRTYRYVRISKRQRGRYHFVLWDFPVDQTLAPYAAEVLKKMGVTTILSARPPPLVAAAYDFAWVPWTGGNVTGRDAENWSDPNYNNYFIAHVSRARPHGALCYSLGDEGATSGTGTGPKSDAAFQRYLKEQYGSVAALNRAWGSAFPTFEAIKVAAGTDPFERDIENLAPDYDRFAFAGWNFVQMGRNLNDRLRRETDPEAVIGFEGAGDLARRARCDPELICREFGMWVPYVGSGDEFVRSVAPREFIRGNWMGYHRDAQGHLGRYWRSILNGADSAWYWMWSSVVFQGFQRPDLGGGEPGMDAFVAETRIMRDGLGDLLLRYDLQHDGIALLYSFPTRYVAEQTEINKSYGAYWRTLLTWQNIVQDLNMQYNYVTERLIEEGTLAKNGYRVLVLPQTLALGEKAAASIRAFVRAGGTVIADLRPGVYDNHGRPNEKGALDDLFGVSGARRAGLPSTLIVTGDVGQVTVSLKRPEAEHAFPAVVDPGVQAVGARALGQADGVPVCLVREEGKGRAILLNFQAESAFVSRGETPTLSGHTPFQEMPRGIGVFFQGLFRAAGVESPFRVFEYKKEGPFMGFVKVQRWKSGEYEIVGLLREADTQTRAASVSTRDQSRMPRVYDIVNRVGGSKFNFWIADLAPGRAALFALLPGPLPAPAVELPASADRGTVIAMTVSVPEAKGMHAFTLRATRPDGTPAEFWNQSVLADQRPVQVLLPLALNDPAGVWSIALTDVFGGGTERVLQLTVR